MYAVSFVFTTLIQVSVCLFFVYVIKWPDWCNYVFSWPIFAIASWAVSKITKRNVFIEFLE